MILVGTLEDTLNVMQSGMVRCNAILMLFSHFIMIGVKEGFSHPYRVLPPKLKAIEICVRSGSESARRLTDLSHTRDSGSTSTTHSGSSGCQSLLMNGIISVGTHAALRSVPMRPTHTSNAVILLCQDSDRPVFTLYISTEMHREPPPERGRSLAKPSPGGFIAAVRECTSPAG